MAKLTRLASTVTARYYPASDLTDAFYLDGRLSGKREARAADITVDKEDRGFFFSVFSHSTVPGRDPSSEPVFEAPLRKLHNEIKTGRKPLDDEIADLVNTAVSVTGRMKLQADNTRSPFFAGVLVKDSEAFAITLGKGLAFLYRDDTLFPLTATDLPMEPVNTQRQKVDNFYNYCATKTATALCSNIAQLKMDDCIILCNREVYDALGQQEILRILYDAEDQCDAAGIIITEAAAKLPGVPLQFMISFVETVTAQEKAGLFGFGKKNRQQSYNDVEDDAIEVPIAKMAPSGAAAYAAPTAAAASAAAAAAASAQIPVPADPLYFGNEATNPFVQPLAEQPVIPAGPKDPIHFQDDSMQPFGEPVIETEPDTDEGGFVKTDFEDDVNSFTSAEDDSENTPYEPDSFVQFGADAPQYIPEESDFEEGEPLVFGDIAEPVKPKPVPESYVMPDSPAEPEQQESEQDFQQGFSYSQPAVTANTSAGEGYYIPFESKEPATPVATNVNDIPDMPLYEAPSFTPPTYPTNSYTPKGYDNAGVYARGSYTLDDEDADMRQDLPVQPKPANRSFSYTPPAQTVPSYGTIKDPSAPQGQPGRGMQQPTQQTPRMRANQPQRASSDMFDQEKGFDYGDTDAAYKRNRFVVGILVAVCVICVVILIVALNSNNDKKPAVTTATTAPSVTLSAGASETTLAGGVTTVPTETLAGGVTAVPTDTLAPTTVPAASNTPVAIFYFTDQTGFRTWWDVFNQAYGLPLESNSDPRIAMIISYNQLPADYVPQPGETINLPDVKMFTATATPAAT